MTQLIFQCCASVEQVHSGKTVKKTLNIKIGGKKMYQFECLTMPSPKILQMGCNPCSPWFGGCYPDDGHCNPECIPANECVPDYECRPGDDCKPVEW